MFGNLRLFSWATEKPNGKSPLKGAGANGSAAGGKGGKHAKTPGGWFLDRNWDRSEGERLLQAKKYAQAETHLARAVAEATTKNQSTSKRIHLTLMLAESQRRQVSATPDADECKKLVHAEQSVRGALQIATQTRDHAMTLLCLDILSEVFAQQGRYDAVEKTTLEAIKLDASVGGDHLSSARRTVRLGVARHRMGRVKEAIPVLANAVEMHEKAFGRDHLETAEQLVELGGALRADGRHPEAQIILRRALEIHKTLRKTDAPAAIQALHQLAGSLEDVGDLEAAAEQYETALILKQRTIGSNLEDIAELQYGLANLHISWKNFGRARELLLEVVGGFRRHGGLRLAVTHETLAYVDECSGRYNEAIAELAQAGKVWETLRPERTQELIRNMERRAELLEQLRRKGEAAHVLDKIVLLNHQLEDEIQQGLIVLDHAVLDHKLNHAWDSASIAASGVSPIAENTEEVAAEDDAGEPELPKEALQEEALQDELYEPDLQAEGEPVHALYQHASHDHPVPFDLKTSDQEAITPEAQALNNGALHLELQSRRPQGLRLSLPNSPWVARPSSARPR